MLISGINTFSLLEFPGEVSCVIFTLGCNMRCNYCHNSEFVLPEKVQQNMKNLIPETALFSFLKKRKGQLSGVSICGGEPTIQKDLKIFCRKLKNLGYKVKLDTNGRDLKILQELLDEKLLDYIAMDIKQEPGKMSEIVGIKIQEKKYLQAIKLILNSKINYEFRTTVIKNIHTKENIKNIAKNITGAKGYFLQNFRPGITLDPFFKGESFSKKELEGLQKEARKYIKHVEIRS